MKVTLLAKTQLTQPGVDWIGSRYHVEDEFYNQASQLAEAAGRICYRSWGKPNPETATNEGYIKNLIEHKHFSVLEHGSVTFVFEGVSRALTHELVRHRHFSFSQVSGRYVDQSRDDIAVPEIIRELMSEDGIVDEVVCEAIDEVRYASMILFSKLRESGYNKKQAQQAARFILPTNLTTDIVVTGNHRSWREFIDKRYSEFADPEIRELAERVLKVLKGLEPAIYQDFEVKDFGKDGGIKH